MKIVGLNIDKGRIGVAVIEKGMRQSELKSSFTQAFATDAELTDILKERSREWAGGRIVSSIPGSRFSQRTLHLPFDDRKRVEKALPFELEDSLPFSLDDMECDHLLLDKSGKNGEAKRDSTVLAVMLPKAALQRHLDLLAAAGVDPQCVVPSYAGLFSVAQRVPVEGVAVLLDGTDLCVKNGGTVLACRSYSPLAGAGGLRHTLKSLEAEHGVVVEKAILLSPNEALSGLLGELGLPVEQVSPDFKGRTAADPVSLGLALSDEINLRKGEFSHLQADAGIRKNRRTLIIAGAIAALLACANLGVKYYLVNASYGKLDREIKEIYKQAVPEGKLVGDPARQLRTKLDESKKKYGVLGTGTSALDVMKAVTEGVPKEVRASFQDFQLEGDQVKVQGDAASFESVDKMKTELQKSPLFADVAVLDTRMGVDNKVKFRFEIKLKQEHDAGEAVRPGGVRETGRKR